MVCCVIFALCFLGGALAELPAGFKACKQSAPGYEDCLKTQFMHALSTFKNGDRKMGIIPLEPLRFQELIVSQGTGTLSINFRMKDVDFHGISTAKITSFKNDWKKMRFSFHLDYFKITAEYSIKGQVLILPISGEGKCVMNFDDVEVRVVLDLNETKKGQKTYFEVPKAEVLVEPKKIRFNFENLFNGNKELGDNMNRFLNENWREIVAEMKPAISRAFELGYREYINRVLSKIPADEINVK